MYYVYEFAFNVSDHHLHHTVILNKAIISPLINNNIFNQIKSS